MLPGPVFNVELVTTARRGRYYAVRVIYAAFLLLILWQNYSELRRWGDRPPQEEYSIAEMSGFARRTFAWFSGLQMVAVLVLTPALVAGVIADERQRKTLHDLLASRLSGAEIVLGKLMARLLHIGVFLAIGLPILGGLSFFGGVDPDLILLRYAGTATTAFFLAGLSILVSTVARRARDAILVVYLLEASWLTLSPMIGGLVQFRYPFLDSVIGPVLDWVLAIHPLMLFEPPLLRRGAGTVDPQVAVAWMCGLQVAGGALAVALAVGRLRPSCRSEGKGRWRLSRRWTRPGVGRLLPRPACGVDPMLWKELHVARIGGSAKLASVFVGLCILLIVGYWTLQLAPPAFAEVAEYGYGDTGKSVKRIVLNEFLRVAGSFLYILCALGVAATAASGVTGEKEGDTWTSLTATDLTGGEILRAKMIGALWGLRWVIAMMMTLWLIGLAAGAVHPFGLVAVVVELAAFLWFAAALGTSLSLRFKSTTWALGMTVAILVFLNGGYLMCCIPIAHGSSWLICLGCTPMVQVLSLMSYRDVSELYGYTRGISPISEPDRAEAVALCFLCTLGYAAAAFVLTVVAWARFDRAVDRPDRSAQDGPPLKLKARPPEDLE